MTESYYKVRYGRDFNAGENLPVISTELDSVRAYQFEVHFYGLPFDRQAEGVDLTLAAKQVSPIGFITEDIETRRVNDKVFYPGVASPEELTITFDNLYLRETASTLWDWFKSIYNPMTGDMTENSRPAGGNTPNFKALKLEIIMLDNAKNPHAVIECYGVYPKSYKPAEFNYQTNEFHTLEVVFRYDFMDQKTIARN